MVTLRFIHGNITTTPADVIVNAANSSLLGGGAIHRAAGLGLLNECRTLHGCKTGQAKITKAYNIKTAKHIIHTVGPVYKEMDDKTEAAQLLTSCIQETLKLAENNTTIAFPYISTGIYGYPLKEAVTVYLETINNYFTENPDSSIKEIILVGYTQKEHEEAYNRTVESIQSYPSISFTHKNSI